MIKINLFYVFIILFQLNIYSSSGISDTIPINNNIKLDPSIDFYIINKIIIRGNKRTKTRTGQIMVLDSLYSELLLVSQYIQEIF